MKGECLCGNVKFEIEEEIRNFYQCHCSLCRKVTGAAANAATFVQGTAFRWVSGEKVVSSLTKTPAVSEAIFVQSAGVRFPIA